MKLRKLEEKTHLLYFRLQTLGRSPSEATSEVSQRIVVLEQRTAERSAGFRRRNVFLAELAYRVEYQLDGVGDQMMIQGLWFAERSIFGGNAGIGGE